MPMPENGKSVLMTPDPYHTPGYGGFCPQFKYQIGGTFGRTTNRLLGDKQIASSGRLVLKSIYPVKAGKDKRVELLQTRRHSWGDQKLLDRMVPGYTGFVPKGQHYFGKPYTENSLNAMSDFEQVQRMSNRNIRKKTVGFEADNNLPPVNDKSRSSLQPIANTSDWKYYSQNVHQHSMSPFFMKNNDPQKLFMSGYTGFVPRCRQLLGVGYPNITNQGLRHFTDDMKQHRDIQDLPVTVARNEECYVQLKPIYPDEDGLVPHYTGHIPGEKFRFGQTFGHSTQNALQHTKVETTLKA